MPVTANDTSAQYRKVEALLIDQVRKSKKAWRAGALALLGVAAVCALAAYFALPPQDRTRILVMCALAVPVAIAFAIPSFGDPKKAKVLTTLRTRSDAIVWVYVLTVRGQGAGSWIVLGLEDGKTQRLPVEIGREKELLQAVAPLAPHATFGFSPENEARFRSAPQSMRVAAR
jgi:hypothetical protein